jgi:hypothetical protein
MLLRNGCLGLAAVSIGLLIHWVNQIVDRPLPIQLPIVDEYGRPVASLFEPTTRSGISHSAKGSAIEEVPFPRLGLGHAKDGHCRPLATHLIDKMRSLLSLKTVYAQGNCIPTACWGSYWVQEFVDCYPGCLLYAVVLYTDPTKAGTNRGKRSYRRPQM